MKTLTVKKDNVWQVLENETPIKARICEGKTKIAALLNCETILKAKSEADIQKAIKNIWKKRATQKRFDRYAVLFQEIFKRELIQFVDYKFSILTGNPCLDVIEFDKFIRPEDGVSTYQKIEADYGSKALKLIKLLIK
jgi:hypothetical protein